MSGIEIDDMIRFALEVDFYINPEVHEYEFGEDDIRRWQTIDLLGAVLD